MVIYRLIAPDWVMTQNPSLPKVLEGQFSEDQIKQYNTVGYNIYYLPNYPSLYEGGTVEGFHIDTFNWLFVDCDLKDGTYESKDSFIEFVGNFPILPTRIVDSGHGVHVYWKVSDLDAKSYLKLQRRLTRHFKTDEAVGKIYQLMRAPNTWNTKEQNNFKYCEVIYESENTYSSEHIDHALDPLTMVDETYCKQHYDRTYRIESKSKDIDEALPLSFAKLLRDSTEVKDIWAGKFDDRSKADFRLGHIMLASGFTKEEATSVLVNSAKALARAPIHRLAYAENIVDKIWTFETSVDTNKELLSTSVKDILRKSGTNIKGTRFPCWSYLDNTDHGFRLGQVIGLVAGSGVGKTSMALNMFMGFVQSNPDHDHFFVPLEQPANEIAERWKTLCGDKEYLHEKVHVISNYTSNGNFRHLSFSDIQDYILEFQKTTGRKVGCVVIDHIGALKKKGKNGENQDLMDICHSMKAFAVQTNTMLVMQSQAPREKAGIGDLELSKDAAYGTMYFEAYCDYLMTLWQPLKRCYKEGAPTVAAFKFCKIRHKNQNKDSIKEDVCYKLMYDSDSQKLRGLTEDEEKSFAFFLSKATNKRKSDRKTELVDYSTAMWEKKDGETNSNKDGGAVRGS